MLKNSLCRLTLVTVMITYCCSAQSQTEKPGLFTAGHASAFIGGLYDGYYPYSSLLKHGDFGLGAPHLLDGKLLILDRKIYQTQSSGKTFLVNKAGLTPFSVVNFFKYDKKSVVTKHFTKKALFNYLDSVLPQQNNIYAIHLKGKFTSVKTRAFPAVKQKPFLGLAAMLPSQKFFTFSNNEGDLVGYRIPAFMDGPNISGYHFHFLSANKQHGGHVLDLLSNTITIEIQELNHFTVDLPQTAEFLRYDFKKDRSEEIRKVENGKN